MEDLLAESKIELLKEGYVISGTIMEIRPTEVVIDFGGKAEGTIPAHEFLDPNELEIGSDIEVFLERLEEQVTSGLSAHLNRLGLASIDSLTRGNLRAFDQDTAAVSGLRLAGYDRPLPHWFAR